MAGVRGPLVRLLAAADACAAPPGALAEAALIILALRWGALGQGGTAAKLFRADLTLPPLAARLARAALALASRGPTLEWLAAAVPPEAWVLAGRLDLAVTLVTAANDPPPGGGVVGRLVFAARCRRAVAAPRAAAVLGATPATLRRRARAAALSPLAGGVGLGSLTTAGTVGTPGSAPAASAAAVATLINALLGTGDLSAGAPRQSDPDGVDAATRGAAAAARFPGDARLRAAAVRLRCSFPLRLRASAHVAGASDHDALSAAQAALACASRRVCAAAVGRGMVTLGSVIPSFAEPVPVPVLTLAARFGPASTLLRLNVSDVATTVTGIMDWPEFHNGVAAGLRVATAIGMATATAGGGG